MRFKTRDVSEDEAMDYVNHLEFDDLLEFTYEDAQFVKKHDPDRIKQLIDMEPTDAEDKVWYKELFEIPLEDWEKQYAEWQ